MDKHGNKYQSFTSGQDGVPAAANNSTVVASTDATLSDLTVTAGGTDLVTFASGTFDYTAMVESTVAEVTVTATKTETNATIEYLDGSDVTLDDADTGTAEPPGGGGGGRHRHPGEGDGPGRPPPSRRTVTVTRAAAMTPTCTLKTGDLWCGVVNGGAVTRRRPLWIQWSVGDLSDNG